MTEKEKMHSGDLYLPDDPDIVREQTACLEKLYDFNQTRPGELARRAALLRACPACRPAAGNVCRDRRGLLHRAAPARQLWGPSRPLRQPRLRQLQPDPGGRHPHLCGGPHHVCTQRDPCHGRASPARRAAGAELSVQHAGPHWPQLLAGAPAASSPKTCPPMCWPWAPLPGWCGSLAATSGNSTSRTAGSTPRFWRGSDSLLGPRRKSLLTSSPFDAIIVGQPGAWG